MFCTLSQLRRIDGAFDDPDNNRFLPSYSTEACLPLSRYPKENDKWGIESPSLRLELANGIVNSLFIPDVKAKRSDLHAN